MNGLTYIRNERMTTIRLVSTHHLIEIQKREKAKKGKFFFFLIFSYDDSISFHIFTL